MSGTPEGPDREGPVREGPFWDAMEGRKPSPPAAVTLGFKLLEIDPERGAIRVQFEAKPTLRRPSS